MITDIIKNNIDTFDNSDNRFAQTTSYFTREIEIMSSKSKVVIPEEIAEWLEKSKETVVIYEATELRVYGCEDAEYIEKIKKNQRDAE